MSTRMKENMMKEMNLKDMEKVCGNGVITGFYNPHKAPGPKVRNGRTENEQKDR